ncbi:MAG TPA: 2'-5' RNA ligase family protein [Chitinophaga sp.]|uniref:2'-5' RNA ligase family protein n=1 Tax=Chitinophaga sp. TaxID=1869181 RepID=UPI002C0AFE5D|nr:2'-5' RNA ligase family protein [Chitinophaga sp.]HVI43477.1 2'-5' RNA ligase family protein [Chitinophaga sp.]
MYVSGNGQLCLFDTEEMGSTHPISEYFILIPPDSRITGDFSLLKAILHAEIPLSPANLRSIAHISLFKIRSRGNEELITQKVHHALHGLKKFPVKLHGAGIFTHGKVSATLYVNIEESTSIQHLHQLLINEFRASHRTLIPHITIARSIPIKYLAQLKTMLPVFDYKDEFICNRIIILKKNISNMDTRYHPFKEIFLE